MLPHRRDYPAIEPPFLIAKRAMLSKSATDVRENNRCRPERVVKLPLDEVPFRFPIVKLVD